MRKFASKAVIICCCLAASVTCANEHQKIRTYIQQKFPPEFVLNDAQISQLAWAFQHDKHTNDFDLWVQDPDFYVEISRALTRLYCAQLLRAGTIDAYNHFVAAQLAANNHAPLSLSGFNKLAQHVQALSASDYALLETAAILSAVSLSKPAEKIAQQAMDVSPVLNDNMGFLAATLRNGINIYPLTARIMQDSTAARKLLYILFPPQTNFRHMLYTEGGIGMYSYIRSMIAHGFIDCTNLDLWYAHWIINIAGFRGHVAQSGSLYLNEEVAQSMLTLKGLVYEILEQPSFDPLVPYLEFRAKNLGFSHLPQEEKLFYAHLGCLMRLYNIEDGQKLYNSLQKISANKLNAIKRHFMHGLHEPQQVTHMYVPALFGNALKYTQGDLDHVVTQILPAYDAILQQAARQNIHVALSFNQLSATKNIVQLLDKNAVEEQRFKILKDGTVTLG